MPRLPRGMVKRPGRGYYWRKKVEGTVKWVALGRDQELATRRLRELRDGAPLPSKVTVAELAKEWLETYCKTARGKKSYVTAEQRVRTYFVPYFGPKRVDRLTAQDLRRYRLWLEKFDIAPVTVHHILADARCILNWVEGTGMILRSPFPKRLMPRIQERPPDRVKDEEAEKLLAVPEPYGFVVRLALATGLRWGELTRVEASDLQSTCLVIHQTKTGKVRRVPLPASLVREIRVRIGRLCPWNHGCAFARMVGKLTGVKFHVHQLRHTFACRWLERGGSLAALQQVLGHSTVRTTERYGRISETHVLAEALKVHGEPSGEPMTLERKS